mgnify:FL=1
MLHQVDEDPDALQIGPHRDALVGSVDAGGCLLRLRHEGTAPQAGVTDLLIVVGVRGPHGHGRQKYHAGVISLQSRAAWISRSTADRYALLL